MVIVALVGVASLIIGCLLPIAYNGVFRAARRIGIPNLVSIFIALLLGFGVASAGLVYLSTTRGGQPVVIVLSFTAGFAIVRWIRGEYRR